ncbi:MAG: LamG domain-containing protein, partial [Verrucomicrobiae bacterium]|nr:LamG domain-containing protein [Verrucomicrobiae bacterium]
MGRPTLFRFLPGFFLLGLPIPDALAIEEACVTPPGGLVGWWPAEADGTDLAGGPGGTLVGAGFDAGEVGQGFRFNGPGQGVDVPVSQALLPPDLSVEAWVRRDRTDRIAGDAGNRAWVFALGAGGFGLGLQPDGHLTFARMDGEEVAADAAPISDVDLHHVAVTVGLGEVRFYVDGQPAGLGRINPFFEIGDTASIGRRPDTGAGSFLGLIDE